MMRSRLFMFQPRTRAIGRLDYLLVVVLLASSVALVPQAGSAAPEGGPAYLVKDINTTSLSSSPLSTIIVGNLAYFIATGRDGAAGLWRSDGTPAGTAHITNYIDRSSTLFAMNGSVFYSRDNQLWKTDGTRAGSTPIKVVPPGPNGIGLQDFTNVNGTLFFTLDTDGGQALWKSDGTPTGTVLVKLIPSPWPIELVSFGSLAYFISISASGFDLWKSDGTEAGTLSIKHVPFNQAGAQSTPALGDWPIAPSIYLASTNGALFFSVHHYDISYESLLWKSDGTTAGTVLLKNIDAGGFFSANGYLFMIGVDETHGAELWRSDGTEAGTVLVKDIRPGPGNAEPYGFANMDGTLFFVADGGIRGYELWKTDGTEAGTIRVLDINPGAASSFPSHLTVVDRMLFFAADDGVHGHELWKSDGTAAGTAIVKDIYPDSSSYPLWLVNLRGRLLFTATDRTHGTELWSSDGTAAGTALVKDVNPTLDGSYPRLLTDRNGTLYFFADDGTGQNLWRSDSTANGTALVKDLLPGPDTPAYFSPTPLINMNGTLFFVAYTGVDYVLWKSDGTAAGTLPLNIYPATFASGPLPILNINGTLFYVAEAGAQGCDVLAKTDGTPTGTLIIGPPCVLPSEFENVSGKLFFSASDNQHGTEIWKSDGTTAGTVLIKDSPGSSSPQELTGSRSLLFFTAVDSEHGNELWKSDGTAAGTVLVKDISPGTTSSNPSILTDVSGTLFFAVEDTSGNHRLWKSDGTPAGTALVKPDLSLRPVENYTLVSPWFTNVNGILYFVTDDGAHGSELWKSDGTAAGTVLVKDIRPGASGSDPADLTNINGTLLFSAADGAGGRAIWRSDGTPAGTRMIQQVASSNNADVHTAIALVGSSLYFSAEALDSGQELWAIPISDNPHFILEAPQQAPVATAGVVSIPISYVNTGKSAGVPTIVATLDSALTYMGDTSGTTPAIVNNTVTWSLPSQGFLDGRELSLRVRVPEAALGTRYSVELRLNAGGVSSTVRTEVMVADLSYLPTIRP